MLRIVEYIEINYRTSFTGQDMIPLLANQRSLWMDCKRLRNSINDTPGSLDRSRMLSEDLEPKGGILSRCWEVRRYIEIKGAVAGIVLWKGGDVGGRGGSGELVVV